MDNRSIVIARVRARLLPEEGEKLLPYKDTNGFWTIGVGHLMTADEIMTMHAGITPAQRDALLDADLLKHAAELDRALPWWTSMDLVRQEVLLDMCFNMGLTKLLGFKNTLAFMKAHAYANASKNMVVSLWYKQVGKRAARLAQEEATGVDDGLGLN